MSYIAETATVADSAQVSDEARVYDLAQVYGEAQVYGTARVGGRAQVYGTALVGGEAQVGGRAQVDGRGRVKGGDLLHGEDIYPWTLFREAPEDNSPEAEWFWVLRFACERMPLDEWTQETVDALCVKHRDLEIQPHLERVVRTARAFVGVSSE